MTENHILNHLAFDCSVASFSALFIFTHFCVSKLSFVYMEQMNDSFSIHSFKKSTVFFFNATFLHIVVRKLIESSKVIPF